MTAFVIKVIASVCMLIDHTGAVFSPMLPWPVFSAFRWVGRIAFPIYAFMVAQGCKHTKNINKYLLRLGIFALVSEIPFDLAFWSYNNMSFSSVSFFNQTNVFYTLFLGVACVAVYEKMKTKKHQWPVLLLLPIVPAILLVNFIPAVSRYGLLIACVVLALYTAGVLLLANFLPEEKETAVERPAVELFVAEMPDGEAMPADGTTEAETPVRIPFKRRIIPLIAALPIIITAGAFHTDYGMFGVGLIFLLYLMNPANKLTRSLILAAGLLYEYRNNLVQVSGDFVDNVFVVTNRDINWFSVFSLLFALASIVILLFYNGKRGKKVKWAFYAFYPVHIAVLAAVWYFVVRV